MFQRRISSIANLYCQQLKGQLIANNKWNSCGPKQNRFINLNSLHFGKDEPLESNKPIQIYSGNLTTRMKAVKVFSLTTSLTGLAVQPILIEQGTKFGGMPMAIFLSGFAGFFTFVTPLLLHFITKKYVTEILYNPKNDEYTAITISIILQKIETKFKVSDVKVPEVPGMFTSFLVDNKSLFVDPSLFSDPDHYIKIMGYDKPIDFKLEIKNTEMIKNHENKTN